MNFRAPDGRAFLSDVEQDALAFVHKSKTPPDDPITMMMTFAHGMERLAVVLKAFLEYKQDYAEEIESIAEDLERVVQRLKKLADDVKRHMPL